MSCRRTDRIYIRVTDEERSVIEDNMRLMGIQNMSTYMRNIAIRGRLIMFELSDLKEIVRLQRICANNLNQYAKKANQTGTVYAEDIADIKRRQEEIWQLLRKLYEKLAEFE